MSYTVAKLAKISGVSVRTLRFYDEIGLLKPAYYGDNGYRYYEEEQMLLLQQILFYRELGFQLGEIQTLIASESFDKIAALEAHRQALADNAKRLVDLIETVDRTIVHLKGERKMKPKDLYYGFAPEKQEEYEDYLIKRYGKHAEKHIAESKQRMKGWTKEDFETVQAEGSDLHQRLAAAIDQGLKPDAAEVQALVAKHYAWVNRFWTPNRSAYVGLGQLYVDHPDFRKFYEAIHPKLADFLAAAMKCYGEAKLSD